MSILRKLARGDFSVARKVYGIVGVCLALLITVASVAAVQIGMIGSQIDTIAEHDIPLTGVLTEITANQLDQSIVVERMLRYGDIMFGNAAALESYEAAKARFGERNASIGSAIAEAQAILRQGASAASGGSERASFENALSALAAVEEAHAAFVARCRKIFELLETGYTHEARFEAEAMETEQTVLNQAVASLLADIESHAEKAVAKAARHELAALIVLATLSLASLVFGVTMARTLVRKHIGRPLQKVVGAINALSDGDTSVDVTVHADDEIGAVARALGFFRQKTVEAQQAKVAQEAENERNKRVRNIAESLEENVQGIIEAVTAAIEELQATAKTMTTTAEKASRETSAVTEASEQASANVETVATAAEKLAGSIDEVTRQVAHSNQIAQEAVASVGATNETVRNLQGAAQKIGEVVGLINDIAEQTNLLALNATIEAARAGEAGKGFAVVASEVKNLAAQTSKATEEISGQINTMQSTTSQAVDAISRIGEVIANVSEIASAISAAVEEQSAATREIAENAQQASSGTRQMASNITSVQDATDETDRSAGAVLEASGSVSAQTEAMRKQIADFLKKLHAA